MHIQPIFVFDGPEKPPFKRGRSTNSSQTFGSSSRKLIELFGFPCHDAPGEAEAECALLQQEGIVDAVLSEDVDTLMFGCSLTLRKWSSENPRGKVPTHVSVYNAEKGYDSLSSLRREGMILVALISGGDYVPEGIPKSGIKLACEAARAGFGDSLCALGPNDTIGLENWKTNLVHEIQTNKSRYFKFKRKNFTIPSDFPNRTVLGYYTRPLVSSAGVIDSLKSQSIWDRPVDIGALREYVASSLGWKGKAGARKFIRNLAPALLTAKLCGRIQTANINSSSTSSLEQIEQEEGAILRGVCGDRQNISLDGMAEIRVIYVPIEVASFDYHAEVFEDSDEDEQNSQHDTRKMLNEGVETEKGPNQPSKRSIVLYDPERPEKVWIPAIFVQLGTPLMWQDWEEASHNPKNKTILNAAANNATAKGGMKNGALDPYLVVIRPRAREENQRHKQLSNGLDGQLPGLSCQDSGYISSSSVKHIENSLTSESVIGPRKPKHRRGPKKQASAQQIDNLVNPWTISQASNAIRGSSTSCSTEGGSNRRFRVVACEVEDLDPPGGTQMEAMLISSSPPEDALQRISPLISPDIHQPKSSIDRCQEEDALSRSFLHRRISLELSEIRSPESTQAFSQFNGKERLVPEPIRQAKSPSETGRDSGLPKLQQPALLGPTRKTFVHGQNSKTAAPFPSPISIGESFRIDLSSSPDLPTTAELLNETKSLPARRKAWPNTSSSPLAKLDEIPKASTKDIAFEQSVHYKMPPRKAKTNSKGKAEVVDLT